MTKLLENPIEEKEGTTVKVKLFTHNDLDGIGCAIVAKTAFGDNCSIEYCSYSKIDEKITSFLRSEDYEEYDAVFITDISVSEQTAEIIQESFADKVQLIDHHGTAAWLNKYDWALVQETEGLLPGLKDSREERLASGTSLLFRFLWENEIIDNLDLVDLVEQIRQYDTWDWKNIYNNPTPKQLNDLLMLIGRYKFIDRFIKNNEVIFTQSERLLLEVENKRIDWYIKSRKNKIVPLSIEGYNIGVVYAEQYHSELGNVLAEEHPEFDFIAMVNFGTNSISYRATKEDVNVGEFAQKMGGGGHPKAAGSPIEVELSKALIPVIFKNMMQS